MNKIINSIIPVIFLVVLFSSQYFVAKDVYKISNPLMYHVGLFTMMTIIYYNFPGGFDKQFNRPDKTAPVTLTECAYYAMSTHTTVGFGDIFPLTNYARSFVMTHMALVFLSVASLFM